MDRVGFVIDNGRDFGPVCVTLLENARKLRRCLIVYIYIYYIYLFIYLFIHLFIYSFIYLYRPIHVCISS